jgi:phosphoglycolate phosphatase
MIQDRDAMHCVSMKNNKMKFNGVIFDLDGTLADTLDDIAGSVNRVLLAHGYPVHPVNDYKLLVGRGLDNLVSQSLPPISRQPALVAKCLSEMIGDYTIHCLDNTHLYEGITALLEELTALGLKLAVFSNKAESLTQKIVSHLIGDIQFIRVMGARSDFPKKPDPTGALFISEQMDIPPINIIYMGDSDVDMIMANRAGMFAMGVLWGFRTREELLANGAKALLNHPLEMLKIIEG